MLEHGAYRLLMDWHYLSEEPIPKETNEVFRRLSARTEEERLAIQTVLKDFFELGENGYFQGRCMAEIDAYRAKAKRAATNGKLGGRPLKTKVVILDNPEKSISKANSITNKPINSLTNKVSKDTSADAPMVDGLDLDSWSKWVDYKAKIRKPIKPVSMLAAQQKLAGFGADQMAVVDQSIANGWQGIFPLGNGGGSTKSPATTPKKSHREYQVEEPA
jgi:uncharacterized protein YdaU (DUF1376 family)